MNQSDAQLSALIASTMDGVIIIDKNQRIILFNKAAEVIYRCSAAQIIGQSLDVLIPDRFQHSHRRFVETFGHERLTLRQTGRVHAIEVTGLRANGEEFPSEVSISQFESGGEKFYTAIIRDISDRKKTELTLRRRDAVLEAVSFAAERFLQTGNWEQSIQEFLAYLGRATGTSRVYIFENDLTSEGSLLARYCYEWVALGITPQIDNPLLQNFPYRASGLGRWEDLLGQHQAVYGNVKDFPESEQVILLPQSIKSIVVVPIFVGGKFWGHMGYDECVIEREWAAMEIEALKAGANILGAAIQNRQAEEALRSSEAEYRSLFENAVEGIYRTTPNGTVLAANPAMVEMFGYDSIDEMKGINIAYDLFVNPHDRHELNRRLEEDGKIQNGELLLKRKDGKSLIVLDSSQAVRDQHNEVLYYEGTLTDITDRKRAEQQLQRKVEQLSALHAIDLAISSSTDLGITLNVVLSHVMAQLNVSAASVLLLNPHSLMLHYAFGQGFRSSKQTQLFLRLGESQAGHAASERRMIFLPDLRANLGSFKADLLEGEGFVSYVCIPLTAKGEVKGVLEIFNRTPLNPDDAWFDFLQVLAGQTAIAIENNTLFADLQKSNLELLVAYDATIQGWSHVLELRDHDTEGHTLRVTELAIELARSLGLRDVEITRMRRGALLHDIGKMAVPDDILKKPGPLTDKEWEIMRKHPQYAYEMLRPIDYLRSALDIPYCHHELWNGSGYPRGLRGEEIPLAARIFSVIDVYDALTSDRPYRKAWSKEMTVAYIREQVGTRFDPKVVEAFLNLVSTLDG